jgi:hypothetical protein
MSSNNCPAVSFFGEGDEEVYGGMAFSHCQTRSRRIQETGFRVVQTERDGGPVRELPVQ